VIAADTSVAVPGALPWHEAHAAVGAVLSEDRIALPAHAAVETYSVLTRLPEPHRLPPRVVRDYLRHAFEPQLLTLDGDVHQRLLERAADAGITGGRIYDAVVAATAREAGATLLTRDRRATRVYELLGVDFRLVE
jgi:predicted nucleic acid-binding protein